MGRFSIRLVSERGISLLAAAPPAGVDPLVKTEAPQLHIAPTPVAAWIEPFHPAIAYPVSPQIEVVYRRHQVHHASSGWPPSGKKCAAQPPSP